MSRSVLYDEPGPKTLRRERIASIVVGILLLGRRRRTCCRA